MRRSLVLVMAAGLMVSVVPGQMAEAAPRKPAKRWDFNGDGRADLVVGAPSVKVGGTRGAGGVYVYRGTGKPVLITRATPGVPGGPGFTQEFGKSFVSHDFNGDGYADLAVTFGNGSGGSAEGIVLLFGSKKGLTGKGSRVLPGTLAMAAGDFDHDGRGDLAVYAKSGSAVTLYSKGLTSTRELRTGKRGFGYALAAGDVSGDGVDDLIAATPDIWTGEDGGSDGGPPRIQHAQLTVFSGTRIWHKTIGDGSIRHIAAADLTGDGKAEVVYNGYFANTFVQISKGGRFAPKPVVIKRTGTDLTLGDATGDGRADLALGYLPVNTDRGGRVYFYPGTKKGVGKARVIRRPGQPRSDAFGRSVHLINITGDRRADLVIGLPRDRKGNGSVLVLPAAKPTSSRFLHPTASGFALYGESVSGHLPV
ncbi:FG-GAP and VCBS repeat-containing protein [Actinocorallia longicatena]|uniref:FG-GAP repeat protein n=1 Tax=Actinocorallia longicatena TaxID=111803 RepID=A0ABP6QCT8_9ACTN